MTAKLDPALSRTLIEQVRAFGDFSCGPGCSGRREECPTRIAGDWAVDNLAGLADQLEAAHVRIAELEAESLKWYKSAADGIDGALEHGVRETAARDLRITELEKLVNELRCGDLGAFHDGELPEGRRAAFERHLVTCERCQAGLRDLLYVDLVASASGGRNG